MDRNRIFFNRLCQKNIFSNYICEANTTNLRICVKWACVIYYLWWPILNHILNHSGVLQLGFCVCFFCGVFVLIND